MTTSENPETAYLAKVTAGATHELRNVLAIVKESAGLVSDLSRRVEQGHPVDSDKMRRVTDRIEKQVQRGADLLSSLNRLAHSLGRTEQDIELNQQVEHFGVLCQRFARQKDQVLQIATGEQAIGVRTNPVLLDVVLLAALECCQAQLSSGGTVSIATGQGAGMAWIEFRGAATSEGAPAPAGPAEDWYRLTALVDRLGASVETTDCGSHFRVLMPIAGVA